MATRYTYRPVSNADDRRGYLRLLTHCYARPDDVFDRFLGFHEKAGEVMPILIDPRSPAPGGVVAGMLRQNMGQYFGGRSVRCEGIAAVGVAPEARGAGAATEVMNRTIKALYDEKIPLSSLYPATQQLYRRSGYEQAGSRHEIRMSMWRIDSRERSLSVREWTPADEPEVRRVYNEFARGNNGALDRGPMLWHRIEMAPPNRTERARCFVVVGSGKKGAIEGYVFLNQATVPSGKHEVHVLDMGAATPRAARRLWSFLASYATIGTDLIYNCGPANPMLTLLGEQPYHMELKYFWMLRVVDVVRAIEARGYPPGYSGEFILDVTDPLIRKNSGAVLVRVRDGCASTARVRGKSSAPRIETSINGLASLYAGFLSGRQCVLAGLCSGNEVALDLVSAAFAGTASGMSDMF